MRRFILALFRLLTELSSRKWLSKSVGAIAKSSFSKFMIRRFANTYQINLDEAELPVDRYRSLNDFFTRRLKPGVRRVDISDNAIVSPVDARISGLGRIENGQLLQVKGQDYSLNELLEDSGRAQQFADGYFFVLYLSPRDYHRIHVPVDGAVTERRHIPGKVYPVNEFGLRNMKRVLSRNERLITYIKQADSAEVAVVKVGALNVSSIRYVESAAENSPAMTLKRGAELAFFEFGSTIVLLIQGNSFLPSQGLETGTDVKMGQRLGQIQTSR